MKSVLGKYEQTVVLIKAIERKIKKSIEDNLQVNTKMIQLKSVLIMVEEFIDTLKSFYDLKFERAKCKKCPKRSTVDELHWLDEQLA